MEKFPSKLSIHANRVSSQASVAEADRDPRAREAELQVDEGREDRPRRRHEEQHERRRHAPRSPSPVTVNPK